MMCEECNGCKNGLMDAGVCYMDLVNELTERAEEEGIELDDEEDIKQCSDCKDGEHENYDDDVKLAVIKDPDDNRIVKRSYMCLSHRQSYDFDGYDIYIIK